MLRCITYISNAKLITDKHYVKLVRVIYFPDALNSYVLFWVVGEDY